MAVPKSLKEIDNDKAWALVRKHERQGTGEWEGQVGNSDFVYGRTPKLTLLRPPRWNGGKWETGRVSM